ncbi:unnamed protein product [Fraxinus pennsylvanica]|uniref:Pectinesterase inhibitor domain-containing protein n=1 Tax=Fraxinus pennsylvanica TaxID=56036 RepID=A0AAD2DMG1_9LAMI|nr:unnamed protein product [Fraxinus pennsylvanica]
MSIIKPETDPNQLFSFSLDIALKALASITHLISNSTQIEIDSEFKTCSSTLQEAVSQLNQTLRTLRVNPDVETLTDEQRSKMTKWIIAAEQELKHGCESTAVGEIGEKVHEAMVHVSNSADFLFNYESVFTNFRLATTNSNWDLKTVFAICMAVSMYSFLIFLFRALFRTRIR